MSASIVTYKKEHPREQCRLHHNPMMSVMAISRQLTYCFGERGRIERVKARRGAGRRRNRKGVQK